MHPTPAPGATPPGLPPRPAAEAGFSLIEGLIAAGLMLLIALGILPLFSSAIGNNAAGQSSTDVSNFGRSTLEEYMQRPWDSTEMTVPSGSTELVSNDVYASSVDGGGKPVPPYFWQASAPTGARTSFDRTTTVRQYQIVNDPTATPLTVLPLVEDPLDGSMDASFVQLKEIDVEVVSSRSGSVLGSGARTRVRVLRPF